MSSKGKRGSNVRLQDSKTDRGIDLDDLLDETDSYDLYDSSQKINFLNIYLSEEIKKNAHYHELANKIRQTRKGDVINFYLSSPGGSVASGHQLINAITDTQAKVNMIVDAPCYSMGALLAVAGSSLKMHPGTFLMFHNYSGGAAGKGPDIEDQVVACKQWVYHVFDRVATPFLTKKEMDYIKDNRDVYIHETDENLPARIKRHFKGK